MATFIKDNSNSKRKYYLDKNKLQDYWKVLKERVKNNKKNWKYCTYVTVHV